MNVTKLDFGTATFPAWSPSPALLREMDSCDEMLELMSGMDLDYQESLGVLRATDSWSDDEGATGADVLAVGFVLALAVIAAITMFISSVVVGA